MMLELTERIRRGRLAIHMAKQKGEDTAYWESCVAELEREWLLGWASRLAEQGAQLPQPVRFQETPLRHITLQDSGMLRRYAAEKLRLLALAHNYRDTGGPGHFPPQWWQFREQEALFALAQLRAAVVASCSVGG